MNILSIILSATGSGIASVNPAPGCDPSCTGETGLIAAKVFQLASGECA